MKVYPFTAMIGVAIALLWRLLKRHKPVVVEQSDDFDVTVAPV
jgi:hypothetical protein